MNEPMNEILADARVRWGIILTLFLLAMFLAVMTLSELKGLRYIGGGVPVTNMVSVNGKGEVFAIPDIASFTFGVTEEAATVGVAQTTATKKMNAMIDYLKAQGVVETDIRTVGYNVSPRYEYDTVVCTSFSCPPARQKLSGFEVSQMVEVKVRATEKAGEYLSNIGERGATNVSGLSFTIDDEESLRKEARTMAIADARTKAEQLAKDLGVRLMRVVSFSESGNDMPYPMYYGKDVAMGMGGSVEFAPAIPVGENKVITNVLVTYEIR